MPKWFLLGFIIRIDNLKKKGVCVSENWKVWKYPHKNGKDKGKKKKKRRRKKERKLIHVDTVDKGIL